MRLKPTVRIHRFRHGIAYLLLVAVGALFMHQWMNDVLDHSALQVFTTTLTKLPVAIKPRPDIGLPAAVHSAQATPNFTVLLFVLGFDLKQNLQNWPVISGDIARSPPSLHFV
ncbi:MAG: hypothetical protein WD688_26865 [Candidatus Binatia bacterium]